MEGLSRFLPSSQRALTIWFDKLQSRIGVRTANTTGTGAAGSDTLPIGIGSAVYLGAILP
jgi:hypothetical protein